MELPAIVDIHSKNIPSFFPSPPAIKMRDLYRGMDRSQAQAEATYRAIYDVKEKEMSVIGSFICKEIKIPEETLHPRKLESFQEEYSDPDIAKLHYKHHVGRRQKNLLRITQRMQDLSVEHQQPD
jgi:hypothetical protein